MENREGGAQNDPDAKATQRDEPGNILNLNIRYQARHCFVQQAGAKHRIYRQHLPTITLHYQMKRNCRQTKQGNETEPEVLTAIRRKKINNVTKQRDDD